MNRERYESELGQDIFGPAYGTYLLPVGTEGYTAERLRDIEFVLGGSRLNPVNPFKNDVFEMRPFCWDDLCACPKYDEGVQHTADCPIILPNFRFGDIEIRWYKYIGRGMSCNRVVTRSELREMFARVDASIAEQAKAART